MKYLSVMLILILNISYATALQDSFITIKSESINLCLSDYNNLVDYKCNGAALQIEGTQDHVIYILPFTDLPKNNSDYNTTIMYYFDKPVVYLSLFSVGFLVPMMFFMLIIVIFVLLIKWVLPKK